MRAGDLLPFSSDVRPMRSDLIAAEASRRGWEVTIVRPNFCHHTKRFMQDELEVPPEAYRTLYLQCGGYQDHMSLRRVLFHIKYGVECFRHFFDSNPESQYDLCIFVSPPLEACFLAMLACKFRKIKFVIDLQDVWPDAIFKRLSLFKTVIFSPFLAFQKLLQITTFKYSDSIISVSEGFLNRTARYRKTKFQDDSVFFLGYPAPQSSWSKAHTRKTGAEDHKGDSGLTFTYIGTLSHSYVLETVLSAASILNQLQVNSKFVIVGDGPDSERLREIGGHAENVAFLGWLEFSQISEVFGRTSIGLIPCDSDVDTMPNKLFEFIYNRIPVLSSLEGEAQRFIASNNVGFSYDAYDVDGLVGLCLRLERDRSLVSELKANCDSISESVSAAVVYRELVDYLSSLGQR